MVSVCLLGVWFGKILDVTSSLGTQCIPPKSGFAAAELSGTWIAGPPDHQDTLIIRPNGTYKQIIHIQNKKKPSTIYESDWQAWWLESGTIPVLHLEDYRLCGYDPDVNCDLPGGSGLTMCQIEYEDVPGEGALYVMGEAGITLTLPLGGKESWFYQPGP